MKKHSHSELLARHLTEPLKPESTGAKVILGKLPDIRAVIFDIYGTLFVSGSGDIGVSAAHNKAQSMLAALGKAGIRSAQDKGELLASLFLQYIQKAQDVLRDRGVQFPEVEIREVWRDFLQTVLSSELAEGSMPDDEGIEALAIEYECLVNPVWPMPGLGDCLASLHESHLLTGIVSNAQFFTPPLFECFLGRSVEELDFEPSCTIYSYVLREAKPSQQLFELLEAGLREHGFKPGQALYIGNDMRNDIAPAAALGFKTCLFAGDKRSLRLREGDPIAQGVKPDRVITELRQIEEIV